MEREDPLHFNLYGGCVFINRKGAFGISDGDYCPRCRDIGDAVPTDRYGELARIVLRIVKAEDKLLLFTPFDDGTNNVSVYRNVRFLVLSRIDRENVDRIGTRGKFLCLLCYLVNVTAENTKAKGVTSAFNTRKVSVRRVKLAVINRMKAISRSAKECKVYV